MSPLENEMLDQALYEIAVDFNNCNHSETYLRYLATILLREKKLIAFHHGEEIPDHMGDKIVGDYVYKLYNRARSAHLSGEGKNISVYINQVSTD